MKTYPKVPRYDHPVVNENVFSHPNTILLEKFDGANCSFMLYHDDFESDYSNEVLNLNPNNNDLIIFSKQNLTWLESTGDKHILGTYGYLTNYLVDTVDKKSLKNIYDEQGVLQFYVEYMREQSISEYDKNIPLAIGFDVYNISNLPSCETPENRYREKFIHFYDYTKASEFFRDINITVANSVGFNFPLNPDEFEIPYSNYGDVKSEGVIIRNDTLECRYKLRSEQFMEVQKESKGPSVAEITSEEDLLDRFCPEMRIRKMINKMVLDEGYEFSKSLNNSLYKRVNEDMWSEEYHEIMRIDADINPSRLNPLLAKRCIKVIEKMDKENAFK